MLLGVILGWMIAALVVGVGARGALSDAQRDLRLTERAVRDLDIAEAGTTIRSANRNLVRADGLLDKSFLTPLRAVPIVSRNLRVTRVLADEALALGTAGEDLLGRAETIVAAADAREPGDPLPIDRVQELRGPLADLAEIASSAAARVTSLDSGALLPPVRDAFRQFTEQATDAAAQAQDASRAAGLAADLLGTDAPKRFFVGATTPAELRGSSGVIGAWSIMEIDDAQFSFEPFNRIFDLVVASVDNPADAPNPDYGDRYGQYDALGDWRNTNMSPDFPSSATVMERLWADINPSDPLDGVLLIDPVAFQTLAERSGPLELDGGITVPADQVVDFVTNGAYVQLPDDRARREAISQVATASLQNLVSQLDSDDLPRTLARLARLFTSGNAQVHSTDAAVQQSIEDLGISGGLVDHGGTSIGLALNNGAGNKVDYWLDQRWEVKVTPVDDGRAITSMAVSLRNNAPSEGFTQEVLGPFADLLDAGDSLLLSTALCGTTCTFTTAPEETEATTDHELGFGVNDEWVELASNETRELRWVFEDEAAWSAIDGVYRHEIEVRVPVTVRPADVVIDIALPGTVRPVDLPPEATLTGRGVQWRPGPGTSRLVITNGPGVRHPSFGSALRRPASSLF